MERDRKDKYLSIIIGSLLIVCFIGALVCHNIPSYKQDSLVGTAWLLHWACVLYIPVFPTIAFFLSLLMSSHVSAIGVLTMNFVLTSIFDIFACFSDCLSATWAFLTAGSLILMLTAQLDKYNSKKYRTAKMTDL